jgi:hypothetical protein
MACKEHDGDQLYGLRKLLWKCSGGGGDNFYALTVSPKVRVSFPLGSILSDNPAGRGNTCHEISLGCKSGCIGGAKNSNKLYLFYMRLILFPVKF